MNNKTITLISQLTLSIILLAILAVPSASAEYQISWYTIDGGGGRSFGGDFTLTGTIGQPDAAYSAGGNYELLGGFWPGGPLCFVNFKQYAKFAEYWLWEECNEGNGWCGGADLDHLDGVNELDLKFFVDYWLCYCPTDWPLK